MFTNELSKDFEESTKFDTYTKLTKRNRTVRTFAPNCTKPIYWCTKCDDASDLVLPVYALFPSPDDVARIFGHASAAGIIVVVAKLMTGALLVDGPTVGGRTDQVDCLVYAQIDQCLRKVV